MISVATAVIYSKGIALSGTYEAALSWHSWSVLSVIFHTAIHSSTFKLAMQRIETWDFLWAKHQPTALPQGHSSLA